MADQSHQLAAHSSLPPPAPPLPPSRFTPFQRFIAPLGFNKYSRQNEERGSRVQRPPVRAVTKSSYGALPSQTAAYRTGIPILALDSNEQKTHAILAGKEILRTVRIQDGKVSEDFNLRSSIISYASTHGSPQADAVSRRREYLPAWDVRWSYKNYSHIVATAGQNGRIALYDVNVAGSRTELAWVHEHAGQVHKLDFDIFVGYLMLSGSSDKTMKMWDIRDLRSARCTQSFNVRSGVRHVAWSPVEGNDFDIALCTDTGVVQLWDARNNKGPLLSIHAHEGGCYSLDWHPDGRHVVSGGSDKYVRVWDLKGERKQKPAFTFKAPQAVRNVKWRPPCWSSEAAESGAWQTTQIATTYYPDDPRIHVWDLRRPLVPFREIDMYNKPATDFLWASKDLIWTCGEEGMFTQNDVNYALQVHQETPPCALKWFPNGDCVIFSEERTQQRTSGGEDPSANFLNVAPEKLSQNNNVYHQRNFEEDDHENTAMESLLSTSFKRRGRLIPTRSRGSAANTSQATSPQSPDHLNHVVQLNKAVQYSKNTFQNKQTGFVGRIPGATTEPEVVEFLANHYVSPPFEHERKTNPDLILQRLKSCFLNNADVCEEASMHRMAQSWRMLQAVIIPELRGWADSNRAQRKAEALKVKEEQEKECQKLKEKECQKLKEKESTLQSGPRSQSPNTAAGGEAKPQKIMSNLLKGVTDTDKTALDNESSSNMTTPLAQAVAVPPTIPQDGHKDNDSTTTPETIGDLQDNDSAITLETIGDLQDLPPSLINSHITATTAARALADTASTASTTPAPSPENKRHVDKSMTADDEKLQSPQQNLEHSPLTDSKKQEERRAALRDYRAQPRPIFTLDAPIRSPQYNKDGRNNSEESFPMFSASTSSSHKARSLGPSSGSPKLSPKPAPPKRGLPTREDSMDSISSFGDDALPKSDNIEIRDFSETPSDPSPGRSKPRDLGLALDGQSDSKEMNTTQRSKGTVLEHSKKIIPKPNAANSAMSSSPEIFQFEEHYSPPPRMRIHVTNPVLAAYTGPFEEESISQPFAEVLEEDDIDTECYLFSDFRPIDLSKYEPTLPFAFSALPMACQMIAYDAGSGVACGQLAAHLLLYIAPYFWHPKHRKNVSTALPWPNTMAERLMRPDLAHRILEGILLNHLTYLQQMHLYESSAALRKTCAELGFERVVALNTSGVQGSSLTKSDVYSVSRACSFCRAPTTSGRNYCEHCKRSRATCPLCNDIEPRGDINHGTTSAKRPLMVYCQACGHSAHDTCMETWLSQEFSEGFCPTVGCGCDCAPGAARDDRLARQRKAHEESRLISGRLGSAKKDPFRAIQSPAVDKTRAALRASSGERGTQSSDERGKSSRKSSSRPSIGGFSASRKSVRLVTPSEEINSATATAGQRNS